jgi:hypothetical protein
VNCPFAKKKTSPRTVTLQAISKTTENPIII